MTDGFILLCDVALGNSKACNAAQEVDYQELQQAGFGSVFGLGKSTPDPKDTYTMNNGCVVPFGKLVANTQLKKEFKNKSALLYDEKMVYSAPGTNCPRVKMAYLVRLNFDYGDNGVYGVYSIYF